MTTHDLRLLDIPRRPPPRPWAEGDNIPWHDPVFSERMLREHLSQEHELASRTAVQIDTHVTWIHEALLRGEPSRVLDLGCGPGLYLHRLARLGHEGVGVDIGPASIRYARDTAAAEGLACRFTHADLRSTELEGRFDLVVMLYGQINVFRRSEAEAILRRAWGALRPGGRLALEMQTWAQVASASGGAPTWQALESGLFSDRPHLVLHERAWDAESEVATKRWYVVDAASGAVERHALSNEAYDEPGMTGLLERVGFARVEHRAGLPGSEESEAMSLVLATRPGA